MSNSPAIVVRNLNTYYGDRHILHDVDLTMERGEILVIMGGSGSGKTTFLNHLLGLLTPQSGDVELLGKNINRLNPLEMQNLRTQTGVAFQSGALFSSMTVAENIALPLEEYTDLDPQTIAIITRLKLEVVSLAGFGGLMPAELSGGMIKRAALARAIATDPHILFCDEPSAGLDPVVASGIDDLLLKLRDALGMSIVVVTHDLDSTFKIADRICILDKGRILAHDTPAVIRQSSDERIQDLLNRRQHETKVDPTTYLSRLLGQ